MSRAAQKFNPLVDDDSPSETLANCANAISFMRNALDSISHNGGEYADHSEATWRILATIEYAVDYARAQIDKGARHG